MKKPIQLAFMMVFVMTTLFFAGCEKEDYPIQSKIIERYSHRHFDIIKNEHYGTYLKFKSKEDFKIVNEYLDSLEVQEHTTINDITPLTKWENSIKGFTSLRTSQKNRAIEESYSSPAFATLLNNNGYIEIAGILYHDKGDKVYIVETGSEILHFDQNNITEKAANCNWQDVQNTNFSVYCSNEATYRIKGVIDHWTNWILGNERIYLSGIARAYDCFLNESYGVKNYTFQYNYDAIIDGNSQIISGTINSNSSGVFETLIASGNDICLNSAYAKFTAKKLYVGGNVLANTTISTIVNY